MDLTKPDEWEKVYGNEPGLHEIEQYTYMFMEIRNV